MAVHGADPSRGAFLSPDTAALRRLLSRSPARYRGFGPVATIIPYEAIDEAVSLAARGDGSLVGSIVTRDPGIGILAITGLAPGTAASSILNSDDAADLLATEQPCPNCSTADPAGQAAAPNSAAYAPSTTTSSAPPSRDIPTYSPASHSSSIGPRR